MTGAGRVTGALLVAALLVGALAMPYVGGYPLGYALIVMTLLGCGWLAVFGVPLRISSASVLLAAAWVLMLIAYLATARDVRDITYAVNFAMLLFLAPLESVLRAFAGPASPARVAVLAVIGTVMAFSIALYQSWELLMPRATGYFADPIWTAQAALIIGFLALVGVKQPGRWTHLYWIGPLLGTLAAFLGQSRGPLAATPMLLAVGIFFAFRRWWVALPVAAIVAAIVIFGVGTLSPTALLRLETMRSIAEQVLYGEEIVETSTTQRLLFYGSSYQAFLQSPWVGYGWESKLDAIVRFLPDHGSMLAEGHHHLHSDVADFGVSAGALGLIAYLLILAAPVTAALRSPRDALFRPRLLGATLLSTGYLFCGLTYLMFGYEYHTTLYVVLTAIVLGYCRERPEPGT